jgi:SM-20-related protein
VNVPGLLAVHDGLLPPELFAELAEALQWVPTYHVRRADKDPSAHPLDAYSFYPLLTVANKWEDDAAAQIPDLDPSLACLAHVWAAVQNAIGSPVRLYECEYTANAFGSEGHPHHDCLKGERRPLHVTAILYCNTEWKKEWAGETVLFDEEGEISIGVLAKPGRVAIIFGDPLHVARGVSRLCPHPRRALVWKMWAR